MGEEARPGEGRQEDDMYVRLLKGPFGASQPQTFYFVQISNNVCVPNISCKFICLVNRLNCLFIMVTNNYQHNGLCNSTIQ